MFNPVQVILKQMYRRSPSKERERDHTEFQLSLVTPVGESRTLPRNLFDDLPEVRETKVQPEATIGRGPTRETETAVFIVIEGSLEIADASGARIRLQPGKVASLKIKPGKPVYFHNSSRSEVSRLLEIWVRAEEEGGPDSTKPIGVKEFEPRETRGTLLAVASGQSHPEAIEFGKDMALYLARLYPPEQLIFETLAERSTFIFLVDGHLRVGEERIHSGDGLAIWRESLISIAAQDRSEFVLIDLPASPMEANDER